MPENIQPKGVICFTNPEQLPFILKNGIYGNRSDAPPEGASQIAASRGTRFGKLKDLLCVAPSDYVFLFEREESRLHGVWRVSGEPVFCTAKDFDPSDTYSYRLYMQQYLKFPNPVPAMELRKLLNKNLLWSLRTFERELAAGFSSVNPISSEESATPGSYRTPKEKEASGQVAILLNELRDIHPAFLSPSSQQNNEAC